MRKKEVKKEKKFNKIYFLIPILIIIVGIILFSTKDILFSNNDLNNLDNISLIDNNNFIGLIEEDTYYIANAKENIVFKVKDKGSKSYIIKDSEGNEVSKTKIKKIDNNYYIVNEKKYKEDEIYTLVIKDNELLDEKLLSAKKVIFKIIKDEVEEYEYNDNVNEVDIKDIDILNNSFDNSSLKLKENDIILLRNDNKYIGAYKIDNITNKKASIKQAELNDIYAKLELYKEFKPDFKEMSLYDENGKLISLSSKEEKEKYIISTIENKVVKEMPSYQLLVSEAKKTNNKVTSNIEFKQEDNKLIFEITINAKANGEKFMGIDALKEHDLTMKFTFEVSLDLLADIKKASNINLSATVTETMKLEISLQSTIYHEGFTSLDDEEYDKTIQDVIKRIEGNKSDSASGRATIGALELPTNIPGLNVYFDLYLQTDTKLLLDINYTQSLSQSQTIGIATIDKELKPYFSETEPVSTLDLDIYGSANARLGIGIDVGLSIISKDIANVNIGEELGFYGDLFATANINYDSSVDKNKINTYAGGLVEIGIYLTVKVNANINVLFIKESLSTNLVDIKNPIFIIGNENITIGIEPAQKEINLSSVKKIALPVIYKNVLNVSSRDKDKVELSTGTLKITNSKGEDLTKTKIDFAGKNEYIVYISYEENNKVYKTQVKYIKPSNVKIEESEINPNEVIKPNKEDESKDEEENNREEENNQPEEEQDKIIEVSKDEAMKYCQDKFEGEKNGVKIYCMYSNIVRRSEDENSSKYHAIYVLTSADPFKSGISNFVIPSCKYGYYYTTLFVPVEYSEKEGMYQMTGFWFEDYAEQGYIGTVTFPSPMN